MLIYYESKVKYSPITYQIFQQFKNSEKIEIHHYKNLFDTKIGNYKTEPLIILAKQEHIAILPTPENYGFPGRSFFFKPSLNCFFNCKYCYLQGTFRNRFPVFFLNYEDMQKEIINQIEKERNNGFEGQITFYASNYADLLATEDISHFHESFLPFCESLPDNVLIETRTKSANITPLLKHKPTDKMEIAFSLSPRTIAEKYELGTASLDDKLETISQLLKKGFRVGLRFLPLLPVENFEQIYSEFLDEVADKIEVEKISSICIAPLIFNEGDYRAIQKKSDFEFLKKLAKNEHSLWTCTSEEIQIFREIFENKFQGKNIFWDYI